LSSSGAVGALSLEPETLPCNFSAEAEAGGKVDFEVCILLGN